MRCQIRLHQLHAREWTPTQYWCNKSGIIKKLLEKSINYCYFVLYRVVVVDEFTAANVQHPLRGKLCLFTLPSLRTVACFQTLDH
jgi:hypothetical protein